MTKKVWKEEKEVLKNPNLISIIYVRSKKYDRIEEYLKDL